MVILKLLIKKLNNKIIIIILNQILFRNKQFLITYSIDKIKIYIKIYHIVIL